MTGLGVQQTNRRMCRYVFVMFIFLCWPQDVYLQDLGSISCEAGQVTVGDKATITCIFPTGTITPGKSNFVVKKFTASNSRDGTDIINCFHLTDSTSGDPVCVFPNASLGYNFTFVRENDRQTVVIPSAKHSDAGEFGCDRSNYMVARCDLTVQDASKPDSDPDQGPGAIIGIVFGILGGVGLLGVAAYFVWRFKLRPSPPIKEEDPPLSSELKKLLPSDETNDTPKLAEIKDAAKPANKKDAAKPADEKDAAKPADKNNAAKPADEKDAAKPADKKDAAKPADEKDAAKPADEKDAAKPADEKDAAKPADEKDAAKPADEKDAAKPADEKDAAKPADKKDGAKPADEKDAAKPATDNENASKPGKGGDRNSKESRNASAKMLATDNKNASKAAKDGGP